LLKKNDYIKNIIQWAALMSTNFLSNDFCPIINCQQLPLPNKLVQKTVIYYYLQRQYPYNQMIMIFGDEKQE
jgi:hypothetical protein